MKEASVQNEHVAGEPLTAHLTAPSTRHVFDSEGPVTSLLHILSTITLVTEPTVHGGGAQ